MRKITVHQNFRSALLFFGLGLFMTFNIQAQLNLDIKGDGSISQLLTVGVIDSDDTQLYVRGGVLFRRQDQSSFYTPGWVPSTVTKQVFAGVFDGANLYAPLLRFIAPQGEFADIGVDTMGNFKLYTATQTRMMVDYTSGYVGIGTIDPATKLHVENATAGQRVVSGIYTGAFSDIGAVYGENDDHDYYGYGVHGKGGYIGVYGEVRPTGSSAYRGIVGEVIGGSGENIGIYGSASGTGRNYGVFAAGDLKVVDQLFVGTSQTDEDNAAAYKLAVNGKAIVEELVVELSGNWPDYVFEEDYKLKPLTEVKRFIEENGHLPEIPSAEEIQHSDGIAVGEMQRILVQKVEELTLYMIQLEAKNKELENQIEALKNN